MRSSRELVTGFLASERAKKKELKTVEEPSLHLEMGLLDFFVVS